jgi:hypothetical protein
MANKDHGKHLINSKEMIQEVNKIHGKQQDNRQVIGKIMVIMLVNKIHGEIVEILEIKIQKKNNLC